MRSFFFFREHRPGSNFFYRAAKDWVCLPLHEKLWFNAMAPLKPKGRKKGRTLQNSDQDTLVGLIVSRALSSALERADVVMCRESCGKTLYEVKFDQEALPLSEHAIISSNFSRPAKRIKQAGVDK